MSRKSAPPTPAPILALDLGSASIRVALVVDGRPRVLSSSAPHDELPNIVGFDDSKLILGDAARRFALTAPRSQVFGASSMAGKRYELSELEDAQWRLVPVERGIGGDIQFRLGGEAWSIPSLLAALLHELDGVIERELSPRPSRVLVSLPPGSSESRRRAVVHSLHIAGFDQIELMHGTSAAAVAWSVLEREGPKAIGIAGLEAMLTAPLDAEEDAEPGESEDAESSEPDADKADADDKADDNADASDTEADESEPEPEANEDDLALEAPEPEAEPSDQLALILDFGANSFDAALARIDPKRNVEILAARSSFELGGDAINSRLVDWMLGQFEDANEVDLSGDPSVRARMRDVAEKTKLALSDNEQADIGLPYLWADVSGPKHLFVTLERSRFERLIHDLVEASAVLAQAVLSDAGMGVDEVDSIVMIGGCSRIPVVQDRIEAMFGRIPETELGTKALDTNLVVRGLALEAQRRLQRRPKTQLTEVASRELWANGPGLPMQRVGELSTPLPLSRSLDIELTEGRGVVELFEGDEDERQLAMRVEISEGRNRAMLHLGLDTDGRIGLRTHPPSLTLTLRERIGLSERAVERLRHEARTRALVAAERAYGERLRGRAKALAQMNESWLNDKQSGIDALLRTSLVQWGRDIEAALEAGDEELLLAGLEIFLPLRAALPKKLREQVDSTSIELEIPDGPEDEQSAEGETSAPVFSEDPSDDYGPEDRVELLEPQRAEDEDEDEPEAAATAEDEVEAAPEAEVEDEDEPEVLAVAEDEPEVEAAPEAEVEDEDEPEDEDEAKAEATAEAEADDGPEADDENEPEAVAVAVVEAEAPAEAETEIHDDDDDEDENEAKAEATADDEDEPEVAAETEADDEPEVGAVNEAEIEGEPEVEAEVELVDEDETEPEQAETEADEDKVDTQTGQAVETEAATDGDVGEAQSTETDQTVETDTDESGESVEAEADENDQSAEAEAEDEARQGMEADTDAVEADRAEAETDQADIEADQADAEPDQADAEPDQADAEPDQADAEPDQADAEPELVTDQAAAEFETDHAEAELVTDQAEAEAELVTDHAEAELVIAHAEAESETDRIGDAAPDAEEVETVASTAGTEEGDTPTDDSPAPASPTDTPTAEPASGDDSERSPASTQADPDTEQETADGPAPEPLDSKHADE